MKKYFVCSLALPHLSVHYGEERLRLQQRSAAGGGPHLYLLHLRQQDPGDGKGDALRLSSKEPIHLDESVWFHRGGTVSRFAFIMPATPHWHTRRTRRNRNSSAL